MPFIEAEQRGNTRRKWARSTVKLVISFVALYLVWRLAAQIGWQEVGQRMAEVGWVTIAAAVACLLGRHLAMHLRWSLALQQLGPQPPHVLRLLMLFSAALVNHLTPAARVFGGVLRARYLKRYQPHSFAELYGVVLADQVSHHVVNALLTWLALVALAWRIGRKEAAFIAAALLPALILVMTILVRARKGERDRPVGRLIRRLADRQSSYLAPILKGSREAIRRCRQILSDPFLQARMALFGLLFFLFNALAQWVIFIGLDSEVSVLTSAITVALGLTAGYLTGTPGGAATTEAAMIACFVALGVQRIDAVAATLLYRGLHYGLILALGLPAVLYFEVSNKGQRGVKRTDRFAPGGSLEREFPDGESLPDRVE